MLVQCVNSVMTVQLEATIVVLSGHQVVQENHLLAAMLAQAETLLVQDQTQDQLVESGLQKDQLVMTVLLEENGQIQDQLVMIEHHVVNGLLRDQLAMTVLLEENGQIQDQLAMTVLLEENGQIQDQLVMIEHHVANGLLKDLSVMTELLVVSGLQKDQLVMTVLLEENGLIQDQLVMTEDQEILVDQIVWKEMTTVREVLMAQETSLLTRRLSLKMLS
jgi:hypothetical protein